MKLTLRGFLPWLGLASTVFGAPHAKRELCASPRQRKSWTALTADEKASYIDATLCLQRSPAKSGIKGAQTRWDELQYAHIVQADYIHFVATFLPFHRYFLTVHEALMRNECGYKGPMPYWDEGADAMNLKASTIFDPKTGFGGDGKGIYRCINDGPFANLTLRFAGDLTTNINYCIIRTMNNCFFAGASKASTDACIAKQSFEEAWHCLEGSPHGAGHGGVGGIMVNVQLSPGDPLFWLHHTWLDSLWWKWQSQNVQSRIKDMTGPNLPPQATGDFSSFGAAFGAPSGQAAPPGCFGGFVPSPNGTFQLPNGTNAGNVTRPTTFPLPGAGAPGSNPNGTRPVGGGGGGAGGAAGSGAFNPFAFRENKAITAYFGDGGGKITTMNHTLWSAGIFPNATIGDVMDLRGPYVCSEYV